ncbi:hypothetical protein B0H65DRAFT_573432 [Neurospora tetraspora]|uniref:JmjC domain-containing protein n=1 Tax=Neurospora tetraspora TaxID=94610 RepID=A0AAE0JF97_9PEZI|nr:hypothetical protein B0H65DRAFT_573432 [Neurospora tetraspora]
MVAIRRKASFSHESEVGDTIHVCLSDHDTIHVHAPKRKRRRTTKPPSGKAKSPASTTYPPLDPNTGAPIPDPLLDDVYRRLALSELEEELSKADAAASTIEDGGYSVPTHGQRTQRLLHSLLQNASHPKTNFTPNTYADADAGPVEALYLNQAQATALIESPHYNPNVLLIVQDKRYFEPVPAVSPFTGSQTQPKPVATAGSNTDRSQYRPISLFFNHLLPTLHRQVSVQIPGQPVTEPSGQLRTLRSIRARFHSKEEDAHEGHGEMNKNESDPWNVLDLSTPIPSTTPSFLQGPGSQLLRYIRSEVLMAAGSSGVISPPPSPTVVESGLVTPPGDSRGFTPVREGGSTPELESTATPEPNDSTLLSPNLTLNRHSTPDCTSTSTPTPNRATTPNPATTPSPAPPPNTTPTTPPSKKRGRPPTSTSTSSSPSKSTKKQKQTPKTPEKRAERLRASPSSWSEWTNVQSWSLLSQGGHHTPPHCDAFGFDTWITVQEGMVGFGWLSTASSTPETKTEVFGERENWAADPHHYVSGPRWRFVILKPKQTVFFPSGTVHFVFRLKSQDSLSVGGHVLRWDGVERWLSVVLEQMGNGEITNEDMEWGVVRRYVDVVGKLVARREKEGGSYGEKKKVGESRWEGLVKEFKELSKRNRCR